MNVSISRPENNNDHFKLHCNMPDGKPIFFIIDILPNTYGFSFLYGDTLYHCSASPNMTQEQQRLDVAGVISSLNQVDGITVLRHGFWKYDFYTDGMIVRVDDKVFAYLSNLDIPFSQQCYSLNITSDTGVKYGLHYFDEKIIDSFSLIKDHVVYSSMLVRTMLNGST